MIRDALPARAATCSRNRRATKSSALCAAAATGRSYLGESVADKVLSGIVQAPLEQLTAREREVLQLVVQGTSNAEAAGILGLSPRSVETYRLRLMQKLGIENLASLVKFAIFHGMVTIE